MRPDGTVTNAPAIGQLYGMPNDIRYAFSDFERERINGQAVVQFAPIDSVTLTLDYTYSRNQITEERGEQTMWLQRSNSFTDLTFDTGEAVATPVLPARHRRRSRTSASNSSITSRSTSLIRSASTPSGR